MKKDKVKDFYFHKAKRENYSARSVYKLENIQEKYKLITKKSRILDLGAAPGSWSEYLSTLLGPGAELIALDINPLSNAAFEKIRRSGIQFHFLEQSVFDQLPTTLKPFDIVLSDMAPATGGNRMVDTQNSLRLIERAFEIAESYLKPHGHLIVKLFQSPETVAASKKWGKLFEMSKLYRPPAVHKDSKEVYFVGQDFTVAS